MQDKAANAFKRARVPISPRQFSRAMLMALAGLLVLSGAPSGDGQSQPSVQLSRGTPEHWTDPGWWPTKGTSKHDQYAGTAACAMCHQEIVRSQAMTPMFQAARLPADAELLRTHPALSFVDEKYQYRLTSHAGAATETVTGRDGSASAAVGWAFGNDEVSQTYVFLRNGQYLEGRLSYFSGLQGLGITPGHAAEAPDSPEHAIGDVVDRETIRRCFGCHTTASTVGEVFDPQHATMGVTCEACHGPGEEHVDAMSFSNGESGPTYILNPKGLSPVNAVDFCGACHRTSFDFQVYMQSDMGVAAVRFQPYRLERSLCWGAEGDARITCTACHDPHKPLVRDDSAYDRACLRCHAASTAAATAGQQPACKVATKDCVSCHMPKVNVPAAHAAFTDHFIRIVRAGEGFRQ